MNGPRGVVWRYAWSVDITKLPPALLAALGFAGVATPACEATACLTLDPTAEESTAADDGETTTGACLSPGTTFSLPTTSDTGATSSGTSSSGSGSSSDTTLGACLEPPLTTTGTDTDTGTGTGTSTGTTGAAGRDQVLEELGNKQVLPRDVIDRLRR